MKFIILSIFTTLIFCANIHEISSQDKMEKMEEHLKQIQTLAEENKPLEQVQLMIEASDFISTSKFGSTLGTQYIYRLSSIPIDIEVLTEQADTNLFVVGKAYEYDGVRRLMTGAYVDARSSFQKAVKLISPYGGEHTALKWLGVVNGLLENFSESVLCFEDGIKAAERYYKEPSDQKYGFMSRIHINLSSLCARTFNLRKAKFKALKAKEYIELANDESLLPSGNIVLAQAELNLHNFDSALSLLDSAEHLITDNHPVAVNFYNTKANILLLQDENEQAIINYNKANDVTNSPAIKMLNKGGIGEAYLGMQKYDEAIANFTSLIDYYESKGIGFTSSLTQTLNRRALSYIEKEELDKAKADIMQAMSLSSEYETLKILNHTALTTIYAKLYEGSNSRVYADSLYTIMLQNDSIISHVREKHRYYEDAMELNTQINDAYAKNLKSLADIDPTDRGDFTQDLIFKYFEAMKAHSLKEMLKTDDAVRIGNISEDVLDEEKQWKYKLSGIMKEIFQSEQMGISESIDSLNRVFLIEKENYFTFLSELEKEYPNYYKFQYEDISPSLGDIQEVLDGNDLLIEYFLDDEYIYTLAITKNEFDFYTRPKGQNWDDQIERFRDASSSVSRVLDQNRQEELFEDFTSTSSFLYQELLADVLHEEGSSKNNLIIVPDDELNIIPFEILLQSDDGEQGEYGSLDYVINDYEVSYEQTAMDLIMNVGKDGKSNKYLGFAPSYDNYTNENNLVALPKARTTIQQVAKLLNGEAFVDIQANKKKFMEFTDSPSVLHFAAHGIIDQENPALSRLVFSDDLEDDLYATDIYDLHLRSDLAVLTACNTGTGKIINGDGVQNLARAFRFAGAESTIMSLWSVPDEQTADINLRFFKNLKDGQNIDRALKNAKLSYLSTAPKLGSHPFFWAGFIPSGNTGEQIIFSSNSSKFLIYLGGGILLIFILWHLLRYSKKS